MHSPWMAANSAFRLCFSSRVFAWVSSPREKSNTSSLSSFRMCMQFSHSVSLLFAAATRSGTKLGQRAGHSCFSTPTSAMFSLLMYARSRRNVASSANICGEATE